MHHCQIQKNVDAIEKNREEYRKTDALRKKQNGLEESERSENQ